MHFDSRTIRNTKAQTNARALGAFASASGPETWQLVQDMSGKKSRIEPGQVDETVKVLRQRNAPLSTARDLWGAWSEVNFALGLVRTDDPHALVWCLARLIRALDVVERGDVFDRLHAKSPFLPATWEVVGGLREGRDPNLVAETLLTWNDTPYWGEIWEELTVWLWQRVRNSIPAQAELTRSIYATTDAVGQLEAGVPGPQPPQRPIPRQSTTALAADGPTSTTSLKNEDGSASQTGLTGVRHAPDFTWMAVNDKSYRFKKGHQAAVIAALFEAREQAGKRDGYGLSEEALADKINSASQGLRICKLFAGHPALKTILRLVSRGVWALYLAPPA